ncbi:lysine N(6)-hydroxylase/L-ornithine N(5)-oxygenase family protein [Paraliobacillus sediminis]|uniref:lysine N(6)-hydroxylase/L-ornithine N(5)-oxygenase family protein n=1 Tax=Paraliobacillus sediminis TaxID=1885916 RepID=UPI000E3CA93F|nr:SidA/IucD/PvdA family monooxygenase [Paraliobacillus sediminis]
MKTTTYDFIGIGIGPYNLGLAALIDEQTELNAVFFDQTQVFHWHPGMLIDGTDLQVSFLADLVTFANPRSQYTYINYLHTQNRLYPFYFFRKLDIPRKEYDAYGRWVAEQLPNCFFHSEVVDVIDHHTHYVVKVKHWDEEQVKCYQAKHVVLGTGSKPLELDGMENLPSEDVFHTNHYLNHKTETQKAKSITIIGSGQSAAEVFYDLLHEQKFHHYHLSWLTRSTGLFQLDESKIGQEVFTPDYVDYFHALSYKERLKVLEELSQLRKGIDQTTLHKIYELLYHQSVGGENPNVTIQPSTEVKGIKPKEKNYQLQCHQWQEDKQFPHTSDKIILATGYKPDIPDWFFKQYKDKIIWEDDLNYQVTRDYQLVFNEDEHPARFFVLTNLEHSHGTGATNLGLAVDRNISIINTIAGWEVYPLIRRNTFIQFKTDQ